MPFQLAYREKFQKPLFAESVVLAHDVDDFSRIWQALGRSRTMNDTTFTIYLAGYSMEYGREAADVCSLAPYEGFIYKELRHAHRG